MFGCPDLPFAVAPLPFTNGDPVRIAQMVDDALAQVIEGLTTTPTAERARPAFEHLTLCADESLAYDGDDLLACFDAMNAHFVANGWSDGMPLVPPTPRRSRRWSRRRAAPATTSSASSRRAWGSAPSRRSPPTR